MRDIIKLVIAFVIMECIIITGITFCYKADCIENK